MRVQGAVMKIRILVVVYLLVASIFGVGISGCTALNTFPQAARGGDTVALALGSPDGMSRANTTAEFVSDADNPPVSYDLTPGIRGIFKLFADKASSIYATGNTTRNIIDTSGHEPWITVMGVDLPQGLPEGPGVVNITTTGVDYPTIGSHINDISINLEILPGVGEASDLAYEFGVGTTLPGDLTTLEALPHAQVMPVFPQGTSWPRYGAIEMSLRVPTTAGTAVRVVFDDMRVTMPSSTSTMFSPRDVNQDMKVMLLNSKGKLHYYAPRFSLVLVDREDLDDSFLSTPVINSVSYYDTNGNSVAGPAKSAFNVVIR